MAETVSITFEVEGISDSGKTTLIKVWSDTFISHLDFGYDVINESTFFVLVRPPYSRRFDPYFKTQLGTRGIIILVDSKALNPFHETMELIGTIRGISRLPLVIAANKQDQPSALSPEDVRIALNIPPEIPIVPCIATDKESVKNVLIVLLDEVLKTMAEAKNLKVL